MGKITVNGLQEYSLMLSRLSEKTEEIAGKALYAGADIVADKVKENIRSLPGAPDVEGIKAWRANKPAPITVSAKRGLLESMGIASQQAETGGSINVKIGFDGYNDVKTKTYPNGQPNALIARSIESGSSISSAHPFMRPAANAVRKQAQKKMGEVVEEEIEKLQK